MYFLTQVGHLHLGEMVGPFQGMNLYLPFGPKQGISKLKQRDESFSILASLLLDFFIFSHVFFHSSLPPPLLWLYSGPYNQQKLTASQISILNIPFSNSYPLTPPFLPGYFLCHEPSTSWRPLFPWHHLFPTFYQHLPKYPSLLVIITPPQTPSAALFFSLSIEHVLHNSSVGLLNTASFFCICSWAAEH